MMVQPNYRFRALTDNAEEVRAVRDAFSRSILWGFTVAAETDDRVLVDLTDFLVRDAIGVGQQMRPGTYRLDPSRSSIYMEMTGAFPSNTELGVELTFARDPGGGGGGSGNANFEGVGSVAASGEAASIRLHRSFVAVPDDGYKPRAFDPRAGFGSVAFQDYAAPLGAPMTQRFIRRHRLEKRDPSARVSDPVEPIVYYLDPGAPEPIRSALLDGARWWNQAFEAAGYRNAFRVTIRPDSISSLDARYNVINWVHRSTRGWSTGGSVTDPRTGEIIKGVVTLGSLRVRQDYMIAEGLLAPYGNGDETPPELALDPSLPGLEEVLGALFEASLGASANTAYEAAVKRVVEGVVVERTMWLAANVPMCQVRAISSAVLSRTRDDLRDRFPSEPNAQLLAREIQRFLDRPGEAVLDRSALPVPPGAPIGDPAMDWLGRLEPWCSWLEGD